MTDTTNVQTTDRPRIYVASLADLQRWTVTLAAMLTEHGEAYAAYVGMIGADYATPEGFSDAYMGEWDSERAYAEELIENIGLLSNVSDEVSNYFDYDAWTHDLFMGDYTSVESSTYTVYVFDANA